MSALYITSLSEYAGKTMLCAGLGKNWQGGGRKVGFFKPRISGTGTQYESDKDAAFMKLVLALQEPVDMLSPIIDSQGDMAGSVKRAYGEIAQGKDIVLVDGLPLNASGPVVEALDAKVLVIHDYSVPLSAALPEYKKLAARLSGVVLNKVPRRKIVEIKTEAASDLPGAGVNFLGVVPEDRVFTALTVAELAELLQGKILNDTEKSEELVENVMLGAMTFDSAIDYYNRKNNKAVILKGERPDMQIAALQTPTRCIVLSGGAAPAPVVEQQAVSKKVPLISAPGDVPFLVTIMEKAVNQIKFNQEKKLPELKAVIQQNLDLELLSRDLCL